MKIQQSTLLNTPNKIHRNRISFARDWIFTISCELSPGHQSNILRGVSAAWVERSESQATHMITSTIDLRSKSIFRISDYIATENDKIIK